jgi:hypothetical protein
LADLVTIDDFVGDFFLQQDITTQNAFNSIRDEWDRVYIRRMLGVELGNLFLADFDTNSGVPTGRYKTIYDPIQDDSNGIIIESRGIKYMMKGITWYYFARQNNTIASTGGNKTTASENSTPSDQSFFLAKNFNSAIKTGREIQRYIRENSSDYPEYNGQYLNMISL